MNTGEDFDLIVVGSGVAGLVAALTAAPRSRVCVITDGALESGCTAYAQGGIAAAIGSGDSPAEHAHDTLAASGDLAADAAVRLLTADAPARIHDLEGYGVEFDLGPGGIPALAQEAAHSHPRVAHAGGDRTGAAISRALSQRLRGSSASISEETRVTDLLLDETGRCIGVEVLDIPTGRRRHIGAGAVLLATGGAGQLWERTTNPATALGLGIGMAFEAGAEVESLEFMQFHPTALAIPGAPAFLISEAVRGEGAVLRNREGRRFVLDSDPRGELAPRDVVAKAIWDELRSSGAPTVFLDCTGVTGVAARFPTIAATCRRHGIDITREPIPVAPAAHYTIGGIRTDLDGRTTVPGLMACGEVASTRIHGANRLASNSLLEGAVFGRRAADAALRLRGEAPIPGRSLTLPERLPAESIASDPDLATLRQAMWRGAGIEREAVGLATAAELARDLRSRAAADHRTDLARAALVAQLACESALFREESRGAHRRRDHPETYEQWRGIVVMQRERGIRLDRNA